MNTNIHKLSGKVAIVTGASKGIGAAIATNLAAAGASVVVNYSTSKEGADRVVDLIARRGGRALAVQANVTKQTDIDRLFAATKTAFGGLDILVNNAGVYDFAPIENVTSEHFHRQFDLNVLGLLLASQSAIASFGEEGGSIINIGSTISSAPQPNASVYSATKGAVDAITASLSKELGARKIRVNSINPGMSTIRGGCAVRRGPDPHSAVATSLVRAASRADARRCRSPEGKSCQRGPDTRP